MASTCPYTREELHSLYWEQCMSIHDIGVEASLTLGRTVPICNKTVQGWMRSLGVPTRTRTESQLNRSKKAVVPSTVSKRPKVGYLCPCEGCKTKITYSGENAVVMCQPHWDLLPLASQMKVWGLFCKEGRNSIAFKKALEVAVEIVGATKIQRSEVFKGKQPIQFPVPV